MKLAFLVLAFFAATAPNFTYTPEEIAEREAGLRKWSNYVLEARSKSPDEAIERLGLGLRYYSYGAVFPPLEDQMGKVRDELKQALLAIPGNADFFANRLREAEARLDEAKTNSERGALRSQLTSEQADVFKTLGLLPSAESVRVVGEYLFDEEGMVPKEDPNDSRQRGSRQYDRGYSPNSAYALQAIAKLPLVSPPVPTRKNNFAIYDEDIEAWRLWYEQVKAGKRTFRFEGDPQEYNLAGPVTKTAAPAMDRSQPTSANQPSQEVMAKPSELAMIPLAGASALLALAIWLVTKKKRSSAGRVI
jgi:hypothetical protein